MRGKLDINRIYLSKDGELKTSSNAISHGWRMLTGKATGQAAIKESIRAFVGSDNGALVDKLMTNFNQALRCMDELFLAYGKNGIVITSTGIPDETGKVRTGTKEMLITAIAKMTVKSNAFEFIDFHGGGDDLARLFDTKGMNMLKIPDYYIRGSITQMDDNAIRKNSGFGLAASFFDFGLSADMSYDLISMDMSIGDAATRKILPQTSTANTMVTELMIRMKVITLTNASGRFACPAPGKALNTTFGSGQKFWEKRMVP